MDLSFITKNPLIKNLALGKLKDACKENGITLISVIPDPITGELNFDTYSEPMTIIKTSDLETLKKLATQ